MQRVDTTPVLTGKVSVVSMFSAQWAERQIHTWTGEQQNPALHEIIKGTGGVAQFVDINMEPNWLKAWLIRLFMWRLRMTLPKERHETYFLYRKGLTENIQNGIGLLNGKVGYVYLLDGDCKIRWAGSGLAQPEEVARLNAGVNKLVSEATGAPFRSTMSSTSPTEKPSPRRAAIARSMGTPEAGR